MIEGPPAAQELELSVFGPGIGESILIHVGSGDWIVVDSCLDRRSGRPAALEYLTSIGVDVASKLKLVVATHWHDDHIRGLAEITSRAAAAKFVNSAAYPLHELFQVVTVGALSSPSAATCEFREILGVLESRRVSGEKKDAVGPIPALANKRLLALNDKSRIIPAEVYALSPADGTFNLASAELARALSAIKEKRRPARSTPNQLSVVLWVKVGTLALLLGADLEHVTGTSEGWYAITGSAERPEGRAKYFKVPHHGSENADCPDCWRMLLEDPPITLITPYSPSRLPRKGDVERICARSGRAFITGKSESYGLPRRDNAVEKTLREMTMSRRALLGRTGRITLRCDALKNEAPEIQLVDGASELHVATSSSLR